MLSVNHVEPKRDRYGRPLIVPEGGDKHVPYTRPTTIADTLDDRHNLELWMQRQVALGLVARPDLVARIATTDPTDKSTLNGICSDARDAAGSSAAANLGTAIHAAVEAVNRGGDAPDMFAERRTDRTASSSARPMIGQANSEGSVGPTAFGPPSSAGLSGIGEPPCPGARIVKAHKGTAQHYWFVWNISIEEN